MGTALAAVGAVGGLMGSIGGAKKAGKQAKDPDRKSFEIKDADKFGASAGAQEQLAGKRAGFANQANQQLIGQLQGQAQGTAPSIAEAQLKQASDRSLAQQLAAAQTSRSTGGTAQREALRSQAEQGQEMAQQAGVQRLQEQQGAQQLLAQQVNQEQAQADQLTQRYMTMGFDINQAQQQALADMERVKAGIAGTNQQANAAGGKMMSDMGGGLLSGAAGALMSDENEKKNKKSASKEMKDFLDKISSKSYKYKDTSKPGTVEGTRYGILAQDLEKSKVGKSFVSETPHGKMVDTAQGFGAVLAAQGDMHKRMKELEKKLKKS